MPIACLFDIGRQCSPEKINSSFPPSKRWSQQYTRLRYHDATGEGHSHQVINDWRPCVAILTSPVPINAHVYTRVRLCRQVHIQVPIGTKTHDPLACLYRDDIYSLLPTLRLLHYFAADLSPAFIIDTKKTRNRQ